MGGERGGREGGGGSALEEGRGVRVRHEVKRVSGKGHSCGPAGVVPLKPSQEHRTVARDAHNDSRRL